MESKTHIIWCSIIRTAETAGVHGIIIPKRRAAAVNSTVVKTSAGATSFMKVARVNNINETIKYLKENNVWIYGTDMETEKMYYDEDLTGTCGNCNWKRRLRNEQDC